MRQEVDGALQEERLAKPKHANISNVVVENITLHAEVSSCRDDLLGEHLPEFLEFEKSTRIYEEIQRSVDAFCLNSASASGVRSSAKSGGHASIKVGPPQKPRARTPPPSNSTPVTLPHHSVIVCQDGKQFRVT